MPTIPLPTDRWVRFLLAPVLILLATGIDRNYQTDLWHHLARGRLIVAEGRMVDEDRFTCTIAGQPLRDAGWLWQVVFYHLYHLGGLPLVQAGNSLLLAAAVALLVAQSWRRSDSLAASAAFALLAVVGLWQVLLIRPQTVSFLLFVLTGYALDRARTAPRWLLLPPLLVALWSNLHGAFPVGVILVGCHAVGAAFDAAPGGRARATWPYLACVAGCLAATCVSPYGPYIYHHVLLTTGKATERGIDEWLPLSPRLLVGQVWLASLLLLILLLARSPRRISWRELVSLVAFLAISSASARMAAWWLLVVTPVLASQAAEAWPRFRQMDAEDTRPGPGPALSLACLLLVAVLSLPWLERFNPVFLQPGRAHRVEWDLDRAARRLEAIAGSGNIYSRFSWGEYLGWALHPEFRVFMDGRIELIPDRVWGDYLEITRAGAGWEGVLEAYRVDCLVLDEVPHGRLLELARATGKWEEVGQYGQAVVLVKRSASRRPRGE